MHVGDIEEEINKIYNEKLKLESEIQKETHDIKEKGIS